MSRTKFKKEQSRPAKWIPVHDHEPYQVAYGYLWKVGLRLDEGEIRGFLGEVFVKQDQALVLEYHDRFARVLTENDVIPKVQADECAIVPLTLWKSPLEPTTRLRILPHIIEDWEGHSLLTLDAGTEDHKVIVVKMPRR